MKSSGLDFGEYNAQNYMPPPPRKHNGGLYTGEKFQENAPWANIQVYPTTDYMTHYNTLRGNTPAPGSTYQYPGGVRPGNHYQEMPGVSCFCGKDKGGAYNILCTPCPPKTSRGCKENNVQRIDLQVVHKTKQHPFYGIGNEYTYSVQGSEVPYMHLYRGVTYVFTNSNKDHPIYISTHPIAKGYFVLQESDKRTTQNTEQTLTIKPNEDTPSIIYLSCRNHEYMSVPISVVDSHIGSYNQ